MSVGPKDKLTCASAVIDTVVCGSDTEGSLYATNHEPFNAVEDHAYCTGCMGCVGAFGYVASSASDDEKDSSLVTEKSPKKCTDSKKVEGHEGELFVDTAVDEKECDVVCKCESEKP